MPTLVGSNALLPVNCRAPASYHYLGRFLSVHEPLRNDFRREDLVSLFEFLEDDPVWKALTTDSNAFEHSVAAQLLQDKQRIDLSSLQKLTDGNDRKSHQCFANVLVGHYHENLL